MRLEKLDPENFEYSIILNDEIKRLRLERNKFYYIDSKRKKYSNKIKTEDGSTRLIKQKAITTVNKMIKNMESSEYKKLLILERKYIRELDKRKLKHDIEKSGISYGKGDYNLAEIGRIFNLSRERVRQIETSALKILQRPENAKIMRPYLEDYGAKEIQQIGGGNEN